MGAASACHMGVAHIFVTSHQRRITVGTVKDVMNYFGQVKPVTAGEFKKFWETCSDEDKAYYKQAAYELLNA